MILRNIHFPPALGASGVQGFYGDPYYPEYKHSRVIRFLWGDIFHRMGFVAKTVTTDFNAGYVKLNGFAFKKFLPDAIYPMPFKGAALNAVNLSNLGIEVHLSYGIWQQRTEPFQLSFMAIKKTKLQRLDEASRFVELLLRYSSKFMASYALQVNFSCPNTGHDLNELIKEADMILNILAKLNVPLIPKINPLLRPKIAHELLSHHAAAALCFSNSIPFGEFPELINWNKFSKHGKSPLELRGYPKGGLSGAPIFPVVKKWLEEFTEINSDTKPIIAGGGVDSVKKVKILSSFPSVESIFIGTAALAKPWVVKDVIDACYETLEL